MNNQIVEMNENQLLRKKAEKLAYETVQNIEDINIQKSLVHELQVHQIELEMQNDELKKVSHELEMSKKHYLDLFDNAPVGYMILRSDGVILQANKTSLNLLDRKSKEIIDLKIQKFIYKEDQDIFYLFKKSILKEDKKCSCELRIVKSDKSICWVNIKITLEKDILDNSIFKMIITDINERKELEEKLKEKEHMIIMQSKQAAMGEMISMIAHQWKQPLCILSMIGNNLRVDLETGNEISDDALVTVCDELSVQVKYLSKTIDDFSDFLKPKENKDKLVVCDVIDNALNMISKSLENHGISISFDSICTKNITIHSSELLQIILNILNNAKDNLIEHDIKDAQITVEVKENNKSIIISICDNGSGIPEKILSRLGEPYLSTKAKNGTGLGVYISKMILEKHMKGSLHWKNMKTGACFEIRLPSIE